MGKEIDLGVVTLKNRVSNGLDYWRSWGDWGVGGWSTSKTEVVRVILDDENDDIIQQASLYDETAKENFVKEFMGNKASQEERESLKLYYSPEIHVQLIPSR